MNNMMFRKTLAQIRFTSNFLPDPQRAERAMCNFLNCSIKLCKRVLKKDLLNNLYKHGVGTNDVELCVYKLSRNSTRKCRDNEIVKFIMKKISLIS